MSNISKVDICILGAGAGGLSVAAAAVQMGAHVALIEAGKMGGDCLNYGCVPSKSLLAVAKKAHLMGIVDQWGITAVKPQIDMVKVMGYVHSIIEKENDRAQIEREITGKIKVIISRRGVVLGVSILGANAGELLLPWIFLVNERKKIRNMVSVIVPYPTRSEISKRVAAEYYTPMLFSKKIRWLVKLLALFG